ncbi:MAG TPA: FecR domain-containing protein [Planctomycetota bacterium]|nr:FecR domain-containing protein [Planctomycetota bacterium]
MSPDRFDVLFERYCDGALSESERPEFLALLGTPEGRARFVEAASYEAAVTEELRVSASSEKTPTSRSLPNVGSRRIAILQEPEPDESRTLGRIAAFAAAAVIGILTLIFAMSTKTPSPPPMASRPETIPRKPGIPVPDAPRVELPAAAPRPVPRVVSDPIALPTPAPRRPEPPELAQTEVPKPVSAPAPTPSPNPKAEAEKPRESATFVATVDQVSGDARLGDRAAEPMKGVAAGQSLSTGRDGFLSLRYPDGSKIDLAGDTVISRMADGAGGKSAFLESGMIFVEAAKQPAGRPMVITTAQADSTVIGTQFVLTASTGTTRLDVREGRVKFTRLPQAVSSVIVTAGHFAVAGGPGELIAKAGITLWKPPTAGLQLWLKADAGTKLNGATVAAWVDQSSSGNSAVQDKPAAQPLWVSNAQAGRPALRFDGTENFLQLPDGFSDFRAGLTVFVVARPAAGGAWSRFIDLDVGPACENIVFGRKDSPDKLGFWVYANSLTKGKIEAPGAVVTGEVQILSARMDPMAHVTLYKNGTALATGDTTIPKSVTRKPNGIARSNAGGSDPGYKGDLFEMLLYNRGLAEAERVYVESYLNSKYLDPATPPVTLRASDK